MSRPLLAVLLIVVALVFVSWVVGELLRQRKTMERRKKQ